jgi:hypothetical protein
MWRKYGNENVSERPDRSGIGCLLRVTLLLFEAELRSLHWRKAGESGGWPKSLHRTS